MNVGKETAYEDARSALRCAIWEQHDKKIVGPIWVSMKPSALRPKGFGCNAKAWTKTLRIASEILRRWKYTIPLITIADGASVVHLHLNVSVTLLYEKLTSYRVTGVTTDCDDGSTQ